MSVLIAMRLGDRHRALVKKYARPLEMRQPAAEESDEEEEHVEEHVVVAARTPRAQVVSSPSSGKNKRKPYPKDLGTLKVLKSRKVGVDKFSRKMVDSTNLYRSGDFRKLYGNFEELGYVLLRGFVPADEVAAAHDAACAALEQDDEHLRFLLRRDSKEAPKATGGYTIRLHDGSVIRGNDKYASDETQLPDLDVLKKIDGAVQALARGREESSLYAPVVLDPLFTWLRVKKPGEKTVEHADLAYFLRETELKPTDNDVLFGTAWLSLEPATPLVGEGGLAVLAKSHTLAFDDDHADVPTHFYDENRSSLDWHGTDYGPGDLLLFHVRTVHATPTNTSAKPRLSLDTRFLIEPRTGETTPGLANYHAATDLHRRDYRRLA
mmetsp:Transcript_10925/g.32813  ORF Transcript_10925/g.32813 Transcript_10925/m.32813 type:complete len:380 (-) Transcript_10925:94-1233(-)